MPSASVGRLCNPQLMLSVHTHTAVHISSSIGMLGSYLHRHTERVHVERTLSCILFAICVVRTLPSAPPTPSPPLLDVNRQCCQLPSSEWMDAFADIFSLTLFGFFCRFFRGFHFDAPDIVISIDNEMLAQVLRGGRESQTNMTNWNYSLVFLTK